MMADRGQLLGLCVIGVVGVEDGFGGPYSYVSICAEVSAVSIRGGASRGSSASSARGSLTSGSCNQTRSIRRNVTAVYLKVLEFAGMRKPERFGDVHGREGRLRFGAAKQSIAEVSLGRRWIRPSRSRKSSKQMDHASIHTDREVERRVGGRREV